MRVLVAGGGTGGHFYPGFAVAERLRELGVEVFWLGATRGLEAARLPSLAIPHRLLAVSGAVGVSLGAKIGSFLRILPALAAALRVLAQVRPHVVFSVGGYAAFPGAAAAGFTATPLVIQEQNAWPGLTHRLLAPWAVAIACGFREALAAFPSLPAFWTGNPVRREFFGVPPAPSTRALLVLGGSQGARILNRLVPEALARIPREQRPRVVHQAGERWVEEVRGRYRQLEVDAEVVGFLAEPWEALSQVPLVVARAGALTVSELSAAGRAAVLIPFAQAAHGHQLANARALAATGGGWILEEREASPEALAHLLERLLADPGTLAAAGPKARALARQDATNAVVRVLLRAAREPQEVAA
ncbi:MAG: undecaprenyldiphospho-muramoylpentapeptide beta-N-acetylglucosaminyltransferase [Thermoanaerobaculum sp.]